MRLYCGFASSRSSVCIQVREPVHYRTRAMFLRSAIRRSIPAVPDFFASDALTRVRFIQREHCSFCTQVFVVPCFFVSCRRFYNMIVPGFTTGTWRLSVLQRFLFFICIRYVNCPLSQVAIHTATHGLDRS